MYQHCISTPKANNELCFYLTVLPPHYRGMLVLMVYSLLPQRAEEDFPPLWKVLSRYRSLTSINWKTFMPDTRKEKYLYRLTLPPKQEWYPLQLRLEGLLKEAGSLGCNRELVMEPSCMLLELRWSCTPWGRGWLFPMGLHLMQMHKSVKFSEVEADEKKHFQCNFILYPHHYKTSVQEGRLADNGVLVGIPHVSIASINDWGCAIALCILAISWLASQKRKLNCSQLVHWPKLYILFCCTF